MGKLIKLMWKYLKKYWYIAIFAPIFMILEVAADMLLADQMEIMIDNGIPLLADPSTVNQAKEIILNTGLIMLGIVLGGVICGVLSGVFTNIATFKSINDMRKDVFNKTMDLSYDQTDKFSTGSLSIRVTNDIDQIKRMISVTLRMLIRQISMFILGIIFTLRIHTRFGIVLLIVLPIELLIMIIFLIKGTPFFSIMQQKIDNVNTIVHENLTGARVVKAFSKETHEFNRFSVANDDFAEVMLKVQKMMALLFPLLFTFVNIAQGSIYLIGGKGIFDGNGGFLGTPTILVGEINQATTYILMICMSLMMFGMMAIIITRAMASSKRILELLETPLDIIDGTLDINSVNDKERGTIEFKNVSFKYPGSHVNALENINFKINKEETVCIVGGTGSGKTTLVSLITRFYDIEEGEILFDGHNIKEFNQKDLRDKIAIALQKSELFAGTIRDNIKWGKPDATDEEINKAIEIAQASEFVSTREKGLDEWIEEKGTSLSGGQKQRLSIARAIIKNPEIMIFDDSTSALDLVTESKLYKAMKANIAHITKIVVAQRIATAKNADRIIVLDNGKIVAFDTHDNLMQNCELYKDIYNSQLKDGGVISE